MINLKKFNLKNFINLDIRWKLKRLSKHTGINFYPNFFKWNGMKGIYTKFIFNLVYREHVKIKKKKIYDEIINIVSFDQGLNFLVSPPSSGSTYLRGIFSSFFEINYKIGNGIPKYDSLTNRWIYSASPIIKDTLFDQISWEKIKEKNREKFISDEEFKKKMIIFSRHPMSKSDLFSFENSKIIILLREPFDWLVSRYTQFEKNYFYEEGQINKKLIIDELGKLNEFILYWSNFIKKNNKKNLLIIKFKDLVENPRSKIIEIFKFYEFNGNPSPDMINRSIEINSKEFTLKNLEVDFKGTRFKNPEDKKVNSQKIKNFSQEIIDNKEILKNYNQLISYTKN